MSPDDQHGPDNSSRVPSMFAGYGPGHRQASPGNASGATGGPPRSARVGVGRISSARDGSTVSKLAPYLTLTAFLLALEGLVLAPVVMVGISSLIESVVALYTGA